MTDRPDISRQKENGRGDGPKRSRPVAWRLLVLLVLINAAVLVVFGLDRVSRTDSRFCANCHNMTSHVDSYLESNHLDSVHRRAKVGCKDCHRDYTVKDEALSVVAYIGGNYEEVFSRRTFDQSMCTSCHIGIDHMAARTDYLVRNPHRGHYPDLPCGACHLAHDRQVDFCGRCHDNGGQRMTGEKASIRAVAPWDRLTGPNPMGRTIGSERGAENHG